MRIEDDEPPIKTKHASAEYRENWERIFGAEEKSTPAENDEASDITPALIDEVLQDDDAIEARLTAYWYWCEVCKLHVLDPSSHAIHAVIKLDEEP